MGAVMWGICLIFVGVGLLGNFTGLFNILFRGWWTIFIIAPATVDLLKKRNKTWSLIILMVGVTLLLQQQGIIVTGMIWKVLIAFGLIILGINTIFMRNKEYKSNIPIEVIEKNDLNVYSAIFSGQERRYDNERFTGATITAVFGGIKIDLRNAIIEEDTVIEAEAIFGGCEITIPNNINVKINNSGIFGGVTNKTNYNNSHFPTIYIKSTTVFGGVEIKQ